MRNVCCAAHLFRIPVCYNLILSSPMLLPEVTFFGTHNGRNVKGEFYDAQNQKMSRFPYGGLSPAGPGRPPGQRRGGGLPRSPAGGGLVPRRPDGRGGQRPPPGDGRKAVARRPPDPLPDGGGDQPGLRRGGKGRPLRLYRRGRRRMVPGGHGTGRGHEDPLRRRGGQALPRGPGHP